MQQLFAELKRLFFNPFEAITGTLETYGSWSGSRHWRTILPGLPLIIMIAGILIYIFLNDSVGAGKRAQAYIDFSDEKAQISLMEKVVYRDKLLLKVAVEEKKDEGKQSPVADSAISNDPKLTNVQPNNKAERDQSQNKDAQVEAPSPIVLEQIRLALERALQIEPGIDAALYRLALVDALEGHLESANTRIAELVKKSGVPNLAAFHWQAMVMLNKRSQGEIVLPADLAPILEKAASWRNSKLEIRMASADMLMTQGRIDNALDQALSAASEDPSKYLIVATKAKATNRERILKEASSKAEKYFETRLRADTDSVSDRIGYAEVLTLTDRKDTAIEVLRAGIDNSPDKEPELRGALANIYLNEFVAAEAKRAADVETKDDPIDLTALDTAATVDPMNPQLGRLIAILLAGQNKMDLTLTKTLTEVLGKQVTENVISPDTLMILGGLYYQKQRYPQAEQFWGKVVELQPTAVIALNNLALLQIEKPQPDPQRGLELIERAYEIAPNSVEVNDSYGQILVAASRPKEAIAMLERALRVDPTRPETRKLLAKAYEDIGQARIAESYKKFVAVMPTVEASKPGDSEVKAVVPSDSKPE